MAIESQGSSSKKRDIIINIIIIMKQSPRKINSSKILFSYSGPIIYKVLFKLRSLLWNVLSKLFYIFSFFLFLINYFLTNKYNWTISEEIFSLFSFVDENRFAKWIIFLNYHVTLKNYYTCVFKILIRFFSFLSSLSLSLSLYIYIYM